MTDSSRPRPPAGAVAPLFRLPSAMGDVLALEDFRGQGAVVLVFLRGRG